MVSNRLRKSKLNRSACILRITIQFSEASTLLLFVLDNLPFDAQVANSIDVAGSSERIARSHDTLVSCYFGNKLSRLVQIKVYSFCGRLVGDLKHTFVLVRQLFQNDQASVQQEQRGAIISQLRTFDVERFRDLLGWRAFLVTLGQKIELKSGRSDLLLLRTALLKREREKTFEKEDSILVNFKEEPKCSPMRKCRT